MPKKIEKRGVDSYRLSVYLGYDNHGKQIIKQRTIQAKNFRDAEKQYSQFESQIMSGNIVNTQKCKVFDFAKRWYHEYCLKELAPKTQESYKNHLEKRILPALGYKDLSKLRPLDIVKFINDLKSGKIRFDNKTGPLSDQTIKYCFRVLSSMLQDAVEWQLIDVNPCTRVRRPRGKSPKIKLPPEQDILRMLDLLKQEPLKYRTIIILAIDTGLRRGELMGLKWSDVNLDTGELHVIRSNQSIVGKGTFSKTPKTEESVRGIMLSESTRMLLCEYWQWQRQVIHQMGDKWQNENWVFASWNGKAMYPSTPSLWFRRFLKRKGLPPIRFHSLRHLSATILISKGVPLKNVSHRLGHADIRTTANIYTDALQSVDQAAAKKMDEFLRQDGDKKS